MVRRFRSASFGVLGTFVLVVGTWGTVSAAPVGAAPSAPAARSASTVPVAPLQDPHTIVASDGKVPAAAPAESRSLNGSSGSVGTGLFSPETAPISGPVTEPGDDGRETVIAPDNRTQVTNTTTFPNRAIVSLSYAQANGQQFICSGFMINKNTVATAGHCVYQVGVGFNPKTSYVVRPGRNGATAPYGSCGAKTLYTVSGWSTSGSETFDYGAIKLNCNIGDTVGWFGLFWTTASQNGTAATVAGYPGDKPSGTQWTHSLPIVATETRQLFYDIDTAGGQSGSPVWTNLPAGNPCVGVCGIAIHTYGFPHGTGNHAAHNHGTRINEEVFNNLVTWVNAK